MRDPDDLLAAGRSEQLTKLREAVDEHLPKLLGLADALSRRGLVDLGVAVDTAAYAIISSPPDFLLEAAQAQIPKLRGTASALREAGFTTSGSVIDAASKAVADAAMRCLDITLVDGSMLRDDE